MSLRDEVYEKFGPQLLEAITDFLLDSVNTLRKEQGMPEYTKDQYLSLLKNHITELPDYNWMKEET